MVDIVVGVPVCNESDCCCSSLRASSSARLEFSVCLGIRRSDEDFMDDQLCVGTDKTHLSY